MNSPQSERSWALPLGCYLSFGALGLTVASLGPALPFLAETTASPLARISYLFVAQNLGYMTGSYGGGLLYDRLRAPRILGVALLAMAALLVAVPVARSFALLASAVCLLGLAQGAVDVGGNILILRTPAPGRQVRMNALHLFFGVGALLAPLAVAQSVARTGTVRWGYWVLALLALPAGAWVVRLPDPGNVAPPAAVAPHASHRPIAALAAFCIFLIVAVEAGFGSWIFSYTLARGLADELRAGYLNSAYWAAFSLGRLAATAVSRRLRPAPVIVLSLAGCLGGILPLLIAGQGSPAAAWAAAAGVGFFVSPLFANTVTLAAELLHVSGQVAGVFLVATSLGGLSLPWLIGQLFQPLGPQVLPWAILITVALAGASYAPLLRRARRNP